MQHPIDRTARPLRDLPSALRAPVRSLRERAILQPIRSTFPPGAIAEPSTAARLLANRLGATLERALLLPVRAGGTEDERRLASLVAGLSLAHIGIAMLGAMQTSIVARDSSSVLEPVLALAAASFVVAYGLARGSRVTAAAWWAVATQVIVPVLTGVALGKIATAPMSTAGWMALALLTANTALGARSVLATGAAAFAAATATLVHLGATSHAIGEGGLFLIVATFTVYFYSRHRNRLERDRRALLRGRNAQLEELRATLERRVEERTSELEHQAAELASAHEQTKANHALLLRTEKMAAVGRLTAGLAHELASPLSAVLAAVDDLQTLQREYASSIGDPDVGDDDHREIAAEIASATELARAGSARAVTFVRGLRAHTRDPGRSAVESFDAATVVQESVDLLAHVARAANVQVRVRRVARCQLRGVPSRFNQAITNLVHNAIDAAGEHQHAGSVEVIVDRIGEHAVLSITDDGAGVPDAIVDRIFEPLFTTKPYGKGTGLGLAIVREVVRDELRGEIEVRSDSGRGTSFVVRLPLAPEEARGA